MQLKIAIVHDWLTGMRGGEKVLEAICKLYPKADLFTLLYVPGSTSPIIEDRSIKSTRSTRREINCPFLSSYVGW